MREIKIIVVDDHELVRQGVISGLADQPDLRVVASTGNPAEIESLIVQHRPSLLLLDIMMDKFNAPKTVRQLKKRFTSLKILIISAFSYEEFVDSLLDAEVDGYWLKTDPTSDLVEAIHDVMEGKEWLSQRVGTIANRQRQNTRSNADLSPREIEVINLCAAGLTNEAIAHRLMFAPRTADRHLERIYDKLDVRNRAEAISKAYERGLIERVTPEKQHDAK